MSDAARLLHEQGDAHLAAGRLEAALASFHAAAADNPDSPVLPFNIGNILRQLGRAHAAIAAYDSALAKAPGFAMAHHNRAISLLQIGDLAAGFREYEWRKVCPTFDDDRYALPRKWQGEDVHGKTLYIWPDCSRATSSNSAATHWSRYSAAPASSSQHRWRCTLCSRR